jgi:hypothetical protein
MPTITTKSKCLNRLLAFALAWQGPLASIATSGTDPSARDQHHVYFSWSVDSRYQA